MKLGSLARVADDSATRLSNQQLKKYESTTTLGYKANEYTQVLHQYVQNLNNGSMSRPPKKKQKRIRSKCLINRLMNLFNNGLITRPDN